MPQSTNLPETSRQKGHQVFLTEHHPHRILNQSARNATNKYSVAVHYRVPRLAHRKGYRGKVEREKID
jgi:hypothetical protein